MVPVQIELPQTFLEEEVKCGYTVSKQMKEVWAVSLDILVQIKKICEKYNIKYYAYSGTMLGCIRHEGFIPWDDDIDIMMKRNDYKKFCEIADKELSEPYFFQTEETDPETCFGMAKIRHSGTTAILKSQINRNFSYNQGISVDIFPLDNVPDDENEKIKFLKKLYAMKQNAYRCRNRFHCDNNEKRVIKKIVSSLSKIFHIKNNAYFKFEKECQKYNNKETEYTAAIFFKPDRKHGFMKNKDFNSSVMKKFEFLELPVPENYEEELTEMFGNWKEYEIGSTDHGDLLLDTDKSYKSFVYKYKVGITVGVFDLFHVGHLNLLERCKERCDYLIVAVCDDDYVLNVKNKTPGFSEKERVRILSALKCVDKVVIVTPEETSNKLLLLEKYPYNVLFSGDDWKGSDRYKQNEKDLAEKGVDVVYFPYTKSISTSDIKKKFGGK